LLLLSPRPKLLDPYASRTSDSPRSYCAGHRSEETVVGLRLGMQVVADQRVGRRFDSVLSCKKRTHRCGAAYLAHNAYTSCASSRELLASYAVLEYTVRAQLNSCGDHHVKGHTNIMESSLNRFTRYNSNRCRPSSRFRHFCTHKLLRLTILAQLETSDPTCSETPDKIPFAIYDRLIANQARQATDCEPEVEVTVWFPADAVNY
jgi:hypothetical protein